MQLVQDRSRWWIAAKVDRQVAGMAVAGVLSLLDELGQADSEMRRRFEAAFDSVIDGLAADGVLIRAVADARVGLVRSGALDARIAGTVARLVGDLRPALGGYVAAVIADWHPDELIARFEQELGPDLQYIRVNGAVLGALIGGALYAIGLALG